MVIVTRMMFPSAKSYLAINQEMNEQIRSIARTMTENDRKTLIKRACQTVVDIDRQ